VTSPIGPLDCEVALERRLALPGIAGWLSNGTISMGTTHRRFGYIAGIRVVGTRNVVGLARPDFDRTNSQGFTPVFSTHSHHRDHPCVLLPSTLNLCTACLAEIWMINRPHIDDHDADGVAALLVAAAIEGGDVAPIVSVRLDDLHEAMMDLQSNHP